MIRSFAPRSTADRRRPASAGPLTTGRNWRVSRLGAGVVALVMTMGAAGPAQAAAGLYLQLGLGYGQFTGSELVVNEDPGRPGDLPLENPNECCPDPGLATQLRVGFSILGFGGPEFGLLATGWNLGGDTGGAGFIGGGIRLFPLKFLSLAGLDNKEFPLDMGLGVLFGYAITGKDFAYTGTFLDFDFHIEYKLASFMSAGIKLDVVLPQYSDFVFTSYKNDRGRCLVDGRHDLTDGGTPIPKSDANCAGTGPSTIFLSPQLVVTFHFDLLDV